MNANSRKTLAVVLGLVALVSLAAAQSTDPKPFLGAWKGMLTIAGQELEIGLNFSLDEAKKVQGTFDSISQNAMGLKLAGVEIKDKTISFLVSGVPGDPAFKGTLDETGKKLAGEFTQAGYAGSFSVEKQ